jgi:hypothetical protein
MFALGFGTIAISFAARRERWAYPGNISGVDIPFIR